MVALARRPQRAVSVGMTAPLARFLHFLLGDRVNRLFARAMHAYFERAASAPVGDGTLFEPSSAQTGTSGGWRAQQRTDGSGSGAQSTSQ
jgi:hypothetical protein